MKASLTAHLFSALCMMLCLCAPASALDRRLAPDPLHHASRAARDGTASGIDAPAQPAGGHLRPGTAGGPFRFGDARFERPPPSAGAGLHGARCGDLAPPFWQAGWFLLLCAALVLGLLWLAYLLRLRQLRAQLQAQLNERMRERERIARELHDTLLQSIQGLSLRFHALVQRLPAHEPVRPAMEEALDRADDVLAEGRDRVARLRDSARGADDLAQALDAVGRELAAAGGDTRFELSRTGKPRSLAPFVQDEVFQVAREAVCNAFRHAAARGITVQIRYRADALQVVVDDDGAGLPPDVQALGRKPGHWGLAGMRERAQSMGARLEIGSREGQGTRVDLTVPAAVAYRGTKRGWLPGWLRRAAGR